MRKVPLGPLEPFANQFDFVLRRGDAALRLLLESMKNLHCVRIADGVDRAIGIAIEIFD